MYEYACQPVRVIDGDSIVLDIDLGLHITAREPCRLRGIDAPEIRGEEKPQGMDSKNFLEWLIDGDYKFICHTHRDRKGKYGRYLVDLWMITATDEEIHINTAMVEEGYAEKYEA